jgi:predicted O-methyltransferase YrrM
MLEHILTDPTARLVGVDPFLGPYKERYFANLEKSGAADKVTTITGYSQIELRKLPLEQPFDIIYIDGSHARGDVLEDAVLSYRLLKPGGLLIFDDYRWAGCFATGTTDAPTDLPKPAIDAFLECFGPDFEVKQNSYQIILQKRPGTPLKQGVIEVGGTD